jgi:hypothetical protein
MKHPCAIVQFKDMGHQGPSEANIIAMFHENQLYIAN